MSIRFVKIRDPLTNLLVIGIKYSCVTLIRLIMKKWTFNQYINIENLTTIYGIHDLIPKKNTI